ncbi:CmcJ/NvfI family oxidoreductase [Marinagarivorans algicola]|uniref:CmcJ/NvfI family oxidoreductase n=1 Tax=Marinagarivorans algicola TaxID=1513270 RepID=UPI0006B8B7E0|nr:CmcJ/NvfI family oxidoreductase [Marinagarivorans algicola]
MNIRAFVNYHVVSKSPQAFHFDVGGIAGNLISPKLVATEVDVKDIRGKARHVNFDDDGIVFVKHNSAIEQFETMGDDESRYNHEIEALLKKTINACEVIVFDHTVRIDDPDSARKPARNVHNDYSCVGAKQRLIDLVGQQRAADFESGSFGFVNVWRPIERPITDSPLGFIRPSSMKPEDWMTIELVYPDRQGEILGTAFNPKHEWFYQSNMQPDEAIIFNIYDNHGRHYLAHSALDISGEKKSQLPRKSIETRTVVRYK